MFHLLIWPWDVTVSLYGVIFQIVNRHLNTGKTWKKMKINSLWELTKWVIKCTCTCMSAWVILFSLNILNWKFDNKMIQEVIIENDLPFVSRLVLWLPRLHWIDMYIFCWPAKVRGSSFSLHHRMRYFVLGIGSPVLSYSTFIPSIWFSIGSLHALHSRMSGARFLWYIMLFFCALWRGLSFYGCFKIVV